MDAARRGIEPGQMVKQARQHFGVLNAVALRVAAGRGQDHISQFKAAGDAAKTNGIIEIHRQIGECGISRHPAPQSERPMPGLHQHFRQPAPQAAATGD